MRVVLVTNGLLYGGAERVVEALAVGLVAAGDAVHVVATTRDGPIGDALRARGIPVTVLHLRGAYDLRVPLAVGAVLRGFDAEIAHSHIAIADLATALARPLARSARIVSTVHSGYVGLARAPHAAWRWALRTFDGVIAVSDSVRRFLPPDLDVRIVRPSLVDPGDTFDREHARRVLGVPTDAPVVMAVGRLVPVKGFDVLARAATMLKTVDARVIVVGDGPERPRLSQLGGLQLLGSRADAAALLAAADVVVSSSRDEGFSQTILQAMAAALPIVATNVGGIPEMITHDRIGLLVPPDDATALAGAIDALLADRERAGALGRAARASVLERGLTRRAMVDQTRAIYTTVVRAK